MKSLTHTFILVLAMMALFACEKEGPAVNSSFVAERSNNNAIIFIPTRMSNTGTRTLIIPIGSALTGGGLIDPSLGNSRYISFYQGRYTQDSEEIIKRSVEPIIILNGFVYYNVAYTRPGQFINQIIINGIDESLGLGKRLDINMNQGQYEGDNELIKDVLIYSLKFASFKDSYHMNKDCDMDIVIITTNGVIISIHFANEETPPDGWI